MRRNTKNHSYSHDHTHCFNLDHDHRPCVARRRNSAEPTARAVQVYFSLSLPLSRVASPSLCAYGKQLVCVYRACVCGARSLCSIVAIHVYASVSATSPCCLSFSLCVWQANSVCIPCVLVCVCGARSLCSIVAVRAMPSVHVTCHACHLHYNHGGRCHTCVLVSLFFT